MLDPSLPSPAGAGRTAATLPRLPRGAAASWALPPALAGATNTGIGRIEATRGASSEPVVPLGGKLDDSAATAGPPSWLPAGLASSLGVPWGRRLGRQLSSRRWT